MRQSWAAVQPKSPQDRAAAARYGTYVDSYDHKFTEGVVGTSVHVAAELRRPVTGAVIVPMAMAFEQDSSLATWKAKQPQARFRVSQRFGKSD